MWCVESWWLADFNGKKKKFKHMWCVNWYWLANFKWRAYIFQEYDVWKAADLLTWLQLTNFQNHVVCERLLICWLCWNKTKNQTHVVCKMVLTCWLWRKSLNFPIIWCVKSCWLADLASTEKFSQLCGVWKPADLLTLLRQKKIKPCGVWKGADLLTLNK